MDGWLNDLMDECGWSVQCSEGGCECWTPYHQGCGRGEWGWPGSLRGVYTHNGLLGWAAGRSSGGDTNQAVICLTSLLNPP